MHKLDDFKVFFSFSIASILVPLAYIIRDHLQKGQEYELINTTTMSILIVIIFVFGIGAASQIANLLIKIRFIRRILLGPAYIEGYWLLITDPIEDIESPLSAPAIAYMSYRSSSRELKIETTRFDQTKKYITQSEVAYIRSTGSTIRYLNFFHVTYPKGNGPSGFSSGKFAFGDHFTKVPQYLEAVIAVEGGKYQGRQLGQKIPDKLVEEYKKRSASGEQNCTDWQFNLINDHKNGLVKCPSQ